MISVSFSLFSLINLLSSSFSHSHLVFLSFLTFILTSAHLYLSVLTRSSLMVLESGCTGPAPISRIVIDRLFLGANHSLKSSPYLYATVSIQSRSAFRLIFGRTGFLQVGQAGIFTHWCLV